jgi:hypothetical protein
MARPSYLDSAWAYTLKIGGRDLHDFGVVSLAAPQLNMSPVGAPFDVLPSRHVAIASTGAFRPSPFVISGQIAGGSVAELRSNLEIFKQSAVSFRGSNFDVVTPLKLETADYTDRYFPVIYTGGFNAQVVGNDPTGATVATFTLPMLRLTPFAIANDPTNATPTATGPSFTVLAAGTAPSAPLIEIEGASTTPSFYMTDSSFYCDFNYDLSYTKIDGSTAAGSSGATTPIDQFSPGDVNGGQYSQAGTFTTSFGSVVQNPTEGSIFLWVNPAFSFVGSDQVLFDYYIDASNYMQIWWDQSETKFAFTKVIGGAGVTLLTTDNSTHTAGQHVTLAVSYGAGNMTISQDYGAVNENSTTTGVTGTSGTIYLGDQAAASRPACNYSQMAMLPYQLDDDTMRRFMATPGMVYPHVVNKSRSASLSANERAVLDFEKGTATHIDTSLTQTNDVGNWDTNSWPMIRSGKTCFYLPSGQSASSIRVNYRKRYL